MSQNRSCNGSYIYVTCLYMHVHTCMYVELYVHTCITKGFWRCRSVGGEIHRVLRESSDRSGPVGRWVGADFTRGGFWRRKKAILNINFCLYDFATRVRWAPAHRPTGPRMTCATVEVFRSGQRGHLRAVDCENVQNSWLIYISFTICASCKDIRFWLHTPSKRGCSGRPFSRRKRSDVGAGRGGPWGANGAIATVTKVHIYPCLQSCRSWGGFPHTIPFY